LKKLKIIKFFLFGIKNKMETAFEKKYHSLEKNHWWFVARREMINFLIRNVSKDSFILDIGCSGGELLLSLQKLGFTNLYGLDISLNAIKITQQRGLSNCFLGDAQNPKINKKFDLIIASDVLEHVRDVEKTISSWRNCLNPNGKIICFVPAFKFLWSGHDLINKHFRRYTLPKLSNLFSHNGFSIEKKSYWNFLLFFPILFLRSFFKNPKFSKNQLRAPNFLINNFLIKLFSLENRFLRFKNFPFGVSAFVVVQKVDKFK